MTHTLDIGTDLDDLLASIGEITSDAAPSAQASAPEPQSAGSRSPESPALAAPSVSLRTVALPTPATSADEPSLISPKVMRGVWYQ